MALLPFMRKKDSVTTASADLEAFLQGYSIEVMPRTAEKVENFRDLLPAGTRPRTAEKVENFRDLLPAGTRVYIAHIDGTPIEDMVATAARLRDEGFDPMPHFPARIIKDAATLEDWVNRYSSEAGVNQGLILAGGVDQPVGEFHSSMQLLETGIFDRAGFKRLHVAGHPEGNRDIDPDGSDKNVMDALRWKQKFSETTDAKIAMATQFCFEAQPVIE
ncbi:MAG: methylenetetrahydrofolate reductase, partial [Marivivens sp.]|nr:methylenetetrahydrofolate reductase [Marivivens sp.]